MIKLDKAPFIAVNLVVPQSIGGGGQKSIENKSFAPQLL